MAVHLLNSNQHIAFCPQSKMAESGDRDLQDNLQSWIKKRGKRDQAQQEWKSTLHQKSLTLTEWKGEAWDLFSPVLLVSLFWKYLVLLFIG